jgi:hypothetical protein
VSRHLGSVGEARRSHGGKKYGRGGMVAEGAAPAVEGEEKRELLTSI